MSTGSSRPAQRARVLAALRLTFVAANVYAVVLPLTGPVFGLACIGFS